MEASAHKTKRLRKQGAFLMIESREGRGLRRVSIYRDEFYGNCKRNPISCNKCTISSTSVAVVRQLTKQKRSVVCPFKRVVERKARPVRNNSAAIACCSASESLACA